MTGGYNYPDKLSSTETLVDGAEAWTFAGELPVAMLGLRGVSLNNDIFMTGNIILWLLFKNILLLQEDMVEDTVTTFYIST